jgi:anti-sigma regulatory factor (Ser/Thr protein kinase)
MHNKSSEIEGFILKNVESHPMDIVAFITANFGISRQASHSYMAKMIKSRKIISTGRTRSTRYFLAGGNHIEFATKLVTGLFEDQIWTRYVEPIIARYPENIQHLCYYGFTEIFNNAIDHSEGTVVFTDIRIDNGNLHITIMDNGIGIFEKIKEALNLESDREAILHLSKGRFTTDPSKHTGEGIFFTSRMFDQFSIFSDDSFYTFTGRNWLLSSEKKEPFGKGTSIRMALSLRSQKTPKEVMDQYADQEIGFHKTIVAVALSANPNDPHVSRSQAKRLLMGVEKFKEIVLDFTGVTSVGPAFIDQIFRVFQNEHPEIQIQYLNANEEVSKMIKRGLARP